MSTVCLQEIVDGPKPSTCRVQGLKLALMVLVKLDVIHDTSAPSSNMRVAVQEPYS